MTRDELKQCPQCYRWVCGYETTDGFHPAPHNCHGSKTIEGYEAACFDLGGKRMGMTIKSKPAGKGKVYSEEAYNKLRVALARLADQYGRDVPKRKRPMSGIGALSQARSTLRKAGDE